MVRARVGTVMMWAGLDILDTYTCDGYTMSELIMSLTLADLLLDWSIGLD